MHNPPSPTSLKFDPLLKWDPIEGPKKIDELAKEALRIADESISWYQTSKDEKGKVARAFRAVAIILLIITSLIPYVNSFLLSFKINNLKFLEGGVLLNIGYMTAALGGGLLLYDRYFGYSTSWIRFTLTAMDVEKTRNDFVQAYQQSYLANPPADLTKFNVLVDVIKTFLTSLQVIIKSETETWAREFQQGTEQLVAALKVQTDQLKSQADQIMTQAALPKTSDIQIEITSTVKFKTIGLLINDESKGEIKDNFAFIRALSPGNYVIKIVATKDDGTNVTKIMATTLKVTDPITKILFAI